jgi:invasion protein IalB
METNSGADQFSFARFRNRPHQTNATGRPMTRLALLAALTGALALGCVAPAAAQKKKQEPKAEPAAAGGAQTLLIGTFGDWKALMSGKDKSKVCYALSQPKDRQPAKLQRDPGFLFVSNRSADGTKGEFAVKLGFAGAPNKDGTLSIGSGSFALVANGESAFLKNPAQEGQVVDLMKRAATISIKVASARGNETTDKYSMNGFAKALEAAAKECP